MNLLELFCGAGGLALGLQKAGFHHTDLYEWDQDSCNNIIFNIQNGYSDISDWHIHNVDVRTVDYTAFEGKVQVVAGGPPCQPFSFGGKHTANQDKRDMFPEAIRAVREIRPRAFIFENVKGLLRKSFSMYFNYILLQLQHPEVIKKECEDWLEHLVKLEEHHKAGVESGLGYNVVFKLLNAADYGVPQQRYRVIIVGFRNDSHIQWRFPQQTHSKESLLYEKWVSKTYWEKHNIKAPCNSPLTQKKAEAICEAVESSLFPMSRWQTVRDAIGDLPDPRESSAIKIPNHRFRAGAKAYAGHSGSVLDEPSKTIKAGTHGVPGGENMFVDDRGSLRYYSVRESARIQTFSDQYIFNSSTTENMRQIGNAVPVKLARVIGESVYRQLAGRNEKIYDKKYLTRLSAV